MHTLYYDIYVSGDMELKLQAWCPDTHRCSSVYGHVISTPGMSAWSQDRPVQHILVQWSEDVTISGLVHQCGQSTPGLVEA